MASEYITESSHTVRPITSASEPSKIFQTSIVGYGTSMQKVCNCKVRMRRLLDSLYIHDTPLFCHVSLSLPLNDFIELKHYWKYNFLVLKIYFLGSFVNYSYLKSILRKLKKRGQYAHPIKHINFSCQLFVQVFSTQFDSTEYFQQQAKTTFLPLHAKLIHNVYD